MQLRKTQTYCRCCIDVLRGGFAASCRELQAGGLCSPEDYLGAREPTIFSKRGSPRSNSSAARDNGVYRCD
jgi:hypothetical protein